MPAATLKESNWITLCSCSTWSTQCSNTELHKANSDFSLLRAFQMTKIQAVSGQHEGRRPDEVDLNPGPGKKKEQRPHASRRRAKQSHLQTQICIWATARLPVRRCCLFLEETIPHIKLTSITSSHQPNSTRHRSDLSNTSVGNVALDRRLQITAARL